MADFILDLDPTKYQVIPDLSSVIKLDTQNSHAVLFLQAGSLPKGKCLPAGVPGFKFVTEQPKLASCPFVVRLTGEEDFVALAFKSNGPNIYLYGLSVAKLKEWSAPSKGDESEEAVLRLININNASLIGACEIADTETMKLATLVEAMLKFLPSFNRVARPKLSTLKGLDEWCARDFTKNISDCAKYAEIKDRKKSGEKGDSAGGAAGAELRKDGGKDIATKWGDALKMLKQSAQFYDHPFDERFILIKDASDVESVRAFLR